MGRPRLFVGLAPGDRHVAGEGARETGEEHRRRNRDRYAGESERDQGGPERREIQDRGNDDRMGVAEAGVVEQEPAEADR